MSNGALMLDSEVRPEQNGHSDPSSNGSSSSLFQRRIEFHLARKPFNGFSNGAGDFKIETLNPSSGSGKFGSGSGQKNGNVKKTDGSDLIDFGLDPELIFGFSLRRIGAGLENLGNTCFLNSVLQCLTHTEPLAAYLQSGKHQNSCRVAGFCALCAIQKHVSRALQSSGRILAPKDLVSNLRCISRNFRNARQEDAHEYMVNLLESMHKCCLPSGVPGESACAYEKSLVHKIFGGRLRSQVKCLQCSYCSDTFDPFLDLSLEIAKADSLDGALRHFTNAELLDGGERQYNCQQCKQKVRAMKRLTVHKAPYVLTIHLKRFRAHDPGQKIDKKIRFCPALDLKPFVSGSHKGELKYTLYGVLVHHGWSTHSGHYYCFVRTSTGIWHSLDDNRVVPVSEKIVLEQKAYMLFYVRDRQSFVPRKPVNIAQKENMKENVTGNGTCLNISHSPKDPLQNGANENQPKILDPSPSVQKNALNTDLSKTSTLNEEPVSKSIGSVIRQTLLPKKDPALKSSKKEQKTVDPLKGLADSASEKERTVLLTVSSIAGNGCTAHDHENDSPKHEARCNDNHQSAADKVETDKAQEKVEDSPSNNMESSLKLMEQSVPSNISSQGVDRKVSENTCCRRFKIFLNGKTASMRLGKHMFLRASLEVWKKRKQRKIKCSTSNTRNLIQESVRDSDAISLDFGPSTSEKVRKNSLDTTHSKRKRVKSPSGKDGKNVSKSRSGGLNSESLMNSMDGELQGRVNQTGAVTNGQLQYISCSGIAEDQSDAPKHSSTLDCKGDTLQNGFIGMLNQGLEEPMVARWDDIDSPPPKLVESTSAKNLSIGYVPDEWDEEYDRGKRKKLRSFKHTFDGPNLFQEIANKQLQSKKIKMDQSSSGSKPFRI